MATLHGGLCEELYNLWDQREGAEHRHWKQEAESEDKDLTELEHAHHHLMTDRQKCQCRLMKKLFESKKSRAIHHTGFLCNDALNDMMVTKE
jgi:hypothetical protein